jgi:hypothetical protein
MGTINWDDGHVISMKPGDTATCKGTLNAGQLYALFFYNSAGQDSDTTVNVVWSNSNPPVLVTVPGTTQKEGLAALCFVYGDDTSTVSASVLQGQSGGEIEAFIGSVKMPTGPGLINKELPLDGKKYNFTKFTRYYAVPASHWYNLRLESNVNQFISVLFTESKAAVYIVNKIIDPSNVVKYTGTSKDRVTLTESEKQSISGSFQGNGRQLVCINADSIQNSNEATICVQSLANMYATME